jgi:hypothetical protein
MANKDLFKQAIAEAKSVREAAIANAKEALEETLTPHLKDMLAAKLQEMEDSSVEEEVVNEVEEEIEEGSKDDKKEEAIEEELTEVQPVGEADEDEAEDDSEESEDGAEEIEDDGEEIAGDEDAIEGDEDLKDLSVNQFKDMIRDIIAQEVGGDAAADDMDAGDIEGMGDEEGMEEPGMEPEMGDGEEEIDLDELIRELDAISEGDDEKEMEEGKKEDDMDEATEKVEEDTSVQVNAESDGSDYNINRVADLKEDATEDKSELGQALDTIQTLRSELNEVNILNAKLLYVNKIFKANNLSESQKVNIIAAFDKAETVKEVKLVFETVADNVGTKKETTIKEHKGSASKATGTTAKKPEVISEVSNAVLRMQKLAGIIK